MFDKSILVNKVVNSLEKEDFSYLQSEGCFDIAAKRKELMLLKILMNVDSLTHDNALSLRAISYFLSAHPFIISTKNNREHLEDDVVYSRFQIPVITPILFNDLISEEIKVAQSSKGRHTFSIDAQALRNKRKEMNYSLTQLAKLVGISKKALYEIEKERVKPKEETVKKLEFKLSVDLREPYKMKSAPITYLKSRNEFQNKVSKEFSRIGIDNSSVYSAPFEIIGKENFSMITTLSQNTKQMKKGASTVKRLSTMFTSKGFFIARKSKEKFVDDVPVILESELPEIESTKELSKILKEKEA